MPRVAPPNRTRLSLVWLVPLLALVVGGWLLVRSVLATGPRIEIEFATAEGLEAGKTEVRYKEVVIGRVTAVQLRADRQKVVVSVQLDRSAAGVARQDTQFWVVRPRIGTAGVSGLGTLFSGAYIGVDAGVSEEEREQFVGLEAPPFMLRGEPGGSFVLVAENLGSLEVGSPVSYRRTRVGRVVGYQLDPARDELSVKIFVDAPYHTLVTPQTRFWNSSGIDVSLNANGLTLDTQTLSSILAGGVSFERLPNSGPAQAAADGSRFVLFEDRKSALAPPFGQPVPVRMVFDQSVRGLVVGAPVDFLGLDIGTVRSIQLQRTVRRGRVPVEVTADIYPLRLGNLRGALLRSVAEGTPTGGAEAAGAAASRPRGAAAAPAPARPPASAASGAGGPAAAEEPGEASVVRRLVDEGIRAQLRTGNLLTGQLFVALDFFRPSAAVPDAKPAAAPGSRAARRAERRARAEAAAVARAEADGIVTIPTQAGTLSELQPQVAEIVEKINRIPFDEIGRGLQGTLGRANDTIARLTPEAQQALAGVTATLNRAQASLDRLDRNLLDESAPVQRQTEQALAEVQRAAAALRVLADYLQRNPETLLRGKPPDAPLEPAPRRPRSAEVPAAAPPPADPRPRSP
ncbi:PqiB family protein [Piscinibacter sakaiensis]|uniref:Paraquat-inducible protein B n=1 Tax=Piscinibacter sakaiensis TaxID=1547922 RepID=A0A0K8NVY4_PISS1|nr:MlaD family protein [Piscinibacter sakaiensis]GAP34546.1 paraquat-inducible protein B [Piscinibacter sakaiensis]